MERFDKHQDIYAVHDSFYKERGSWNNQIDGTSQDGLLDGIKENTRFGLFQHGEHIRHKTE